MALKLDENDLAGFAKIRSLSKEAFNDLLGALESASNKSSFTEIAESARTNASSIPEPDLQAILLTLDTAYHIREFSGVRGTRFLSDLMDGLLQSDYPELKLAEDEIATFRDRVSQLLSVQPIRVLAKADRLRQEGESVYCESKLFSDIRPIFTEDANARPVGAVITHTLKIACHTSDGHDDFRILLDSEDLEKLKEVVDRASAKDKTLRGLVKELKIQSYD